MASMARPVLVDFFGKEGAPVSLIAQILCVFALSLSVDVQAQSTNATSHQSVGPERVSVEVTIASRNGGDLLSRTIEGLARLKLFRQFEETLTRSPDPDEKEANCISNARPDKSGRLFDVARCLRVWPESGQAPPVKRFEKNFADEIATTDLSAFPAIEVTSFPINLRLQSTQLPPEAIEFLPGGQFGQPRITDKYRAVLCDPKVTFIELHNCTVDVVFRFGVYSTDIFVTQTAYRVRLLNSMDEETAIELQRALARTLAMARNAPADALRITILRDAPAKSQQLVSPPAPENSVQKNSIEELWSAMGARPELLNLSNHNDPVPPSLLVFDKAERETPFSIQNWLQTVSAGNFRIPPTGCEALAESDHTEGVTSLLFPNIVLSALQRPQDTAALSIPPPSWNGYFLSARHFKGLPAIGQKPWYESGFAAVGSPLISLVVYSHFYGVSDNSAAEQAAATYLANPSNLLVVSAPQIDQVGQATKFGSKVLPVIEPALLETMCVGRAWPACLGRHPRVLVVAPLSYPTPLTTPLSLFEPGSYQLGASTVRMAAPGGQIPVLTRCPPGADANDNSVWGVAPINGTSFAAPLVTLVLTRLIQIGPQGISSLPEAAIWRILATTNPIKQDDGMAESPTEFGGLDAGRAMRGASAVEVGPDYASMLYEQGVDDVQSISSAVIMPFPWNDQPMNSEMRGLKYAIEVVPRNVITYSQIGSGDTSTRTETLEFRQLLRLVRRTNDFVKGTPLFDLYYVDLTNSQLPYVSVRRRVRLGPSDLIDAPGFCRSNGIVSPPTGGDLQSQTQPACLYAWRKGEAHFVPLDLNKVTDIVFPPLHYSSGFPAGINPSDVRITAASHSPWAIAFCNIGPRMRLRKTLAQLQQPSWETACKRQ
jgi:hypothetical protein